MATKPNTVRYSNRQLQSDGTSTEHVLLEEDGLLRYTVTTNGETSSKVLGEAPMDLAGALASEPALIRVGTGYTDIRYDGPLPLHDLLGLLIVDEPDADEPDPDDWGDEDGEPRHGIDLDDLCAGDEEMTAMTAPEGFDIVSRWIMIDGERCFVLRGKDFAAVGLVDPDSDWNKPFVTDELISWGFYGESGGPCTWDGGAELGWCGSRLWVLKRWGDYEPLMYVFPAPEPDQMAEELKDWILGLDWELPYLIAAVGLPGLTPDDKEALWSAGDVEGNDVSSNLSAAMNEQVVTSLVNSYPELGEAARSLRDPHSERGQAVYGWLRQIAHGPYQSGSWNHVHQAMLGHIGPPADDQRAPTMQERWEANIRRANAVIQEAKGLSPGEAEQAAAVRETHERLTEQVDEALKGLDDARRRNLQARLDDMATARQAAAESREFLRAYDENISLHSRAMERIAEHPDDQDWVADVWSAFWTAQSAPTAGEEADLRTHLADETRARGKFTAEEARTAKEALSAGWPSTWLPALHSIWIEQGGTVRSARAWAEAGQDPVDVLLGNPRTPAAMEDLERRLRDEEPPLAQDPRPDRLPDAEN